MGTGGPNRDVEAGYLIRPPVIVAYLTQANDIHRISGAPAPTRGSSIPLLAALPLNRDARIPHLDPGRTTRPGPDSCGAPKTRHLRNRFARSHAWIGFAK